MSTVLNFGRDNQGYNAYAPAFASDAFSATLDANDAQSFTVPSNYKVWIAVFGATPGATIWVAVNDTAEVPAGGTFLSTSSTINPGARTVHAGDTISVITDTSGGCDVGVALYAVTL